MTVGVSEDSWATVPKDGALTLDEAKCHALAQEFINGNVTQGTTTAMLVSAIIAHVRKAARDDALETVRQCERRSGACVMVHSLLNPEHPNLCNEENCSSIRAMNRL